MIIGKMRPETRVAPTSTEAITENKAPTQAISKEGKQVFGVNDTAYRVIVKG